MNPRFFGDSYDIVKRFFCTELRALGYDVVVDLQATGEWTTSTRSRFFQFLGAEDWMNDSPSSRRVALFLDPDTGISARGGEKHISYDQLVSQCGRYAIVFAFDQGFSRLPNRACEAMQKKLDDLLRHGCHGWYYCSHAKFLFVSKSEATLSQVRDHLISLGLPPSRIVEIQKPQAPTL